MVRLSRARRLVVTLLTLAGLSSVCAFVVAQDRLRLSRSTAGESRPILIDADEVATWMEGGQRVLLLKGNVLVQQGALQARFEQGVVWMDTAGFQRTRIMRLDVFAEGNVDIENGSENQRGATALFDLSTRGELKLNAHKNKVVQEPRPNDPLLRHALAERTRPAGAPPAAISASAAPPPATAGPPAAPVAPPTPDRDVQPVQFSPPPSPPPPARIGPPEPETAPQPRPGPGLPFAARPPTRPTAPNAPLRTFSLAPRSSQPFQARIEETPSGEQALVVTGGIILQVRDAAGLGMIDVEADRLVLWTRGGSPSFFENLRTPEGQVSRELEFYIAGHVEIRQQSPNTSEARTVRADELYYDVSRNVAIALNADLEYKVPKLLYPVHMRADELLQTSMTTFEAAQAVVFSSRLPSDPGLTVQLSHATLEEKKVPKKSIFGKQVYDRKTGQPQSEPQSIVQGSNVFFKVEDVPVFYLPFVQADARDPLGPIEDFNIGFNRIFGFRIGTSLNVWDLAGIDPPPGTRWRLDLDYMSQRGPALGTNLDYAGTDPFGIPGSYVGQFRAWGLRDQGQDILGGGRGANDDHPLWRGRVFSRNLVTGLPYGFSVQTQVSSLSDKNFLEQFFKPEFDLGYNQESFLYVKQQQDNWAWTGLTEGRLFGWMTQTQWLPRADGFLIGQSFFQMFTYNAWANAGYAQLRPADLPPPPVHATDVNINTGRFDLMQELSLPFYAGPVRVVPYATLDLTNYTQDLTGDDANRIYGGGGARASLPFSRTYPGVESLLWNLNGINHKVEFSANYFITRTNVSFGQLPQLDRLNDDATDQALRDITPVQPVFNPPNGRFLQTSPLFDPQTYAIRRVVESRVDTRDDLQVLQGLIRQRWQTKRGYPGQQHIVDWMRLDLSGSYFPEADRDNFGESFAFLQYDWLWNIGDRTALASTGWIDPIDHATRVFTLGAYLNRPDRTDFYLGYRQIDPLRSKAVTGAVSYVFSPKYAVTGSSTYDFGTGQSLSNSVVLTRIGKDLQIGVGVTYNVLQNNFGLLVQVLPNLAAGRGGPSFGLPTIGGDPLAGYR